jgi:hypothetical protein
MEKLAQIMNEIREYLHTFEELKDKSCIIEPWIELEDNIKNILEEKEEKKVEYNNYKLINYHECLQCKNGLITDKDKDQVVRCECGVKYYVHNNCLFPIKEAETNSWQDGNIRKWKCGCDSVMACDSSEDRVITCGICNRKYAWDNKLKRITYISETGKGEGDTSGFEVDHAWKIAVEAKERLGIK